TAPTLIRCDPNAHRVHADHQQPWSADGLPHFFERRISTCDDFVQEQRQAEYATTHADVRTDCLALGGIEFNGHPAAAHHHGRLAHVRREPSVIVNEGKHVFCRRSEQAASLTMASSHTAPRLGLPHPYVSISGANRRALSAGR